MTFRSPALPRNLLQAPRHIRVMIWIMAIMVFLTILAAGSGLALRHAIGSLDESLAARLTVQVVESDAAQRDRATAAIVSRLHKVPGVASVEQVSRQHLRSLLKPWMGGEGLGEDIPIPDMIDVDLASGDPVLIAAVRDAARGISRNVLIDRHADWLSPVRDFLAMLGWSALSIVFLMLCATASVVLLAARTGIDTHRDTIEVLHMLGTANKQVARLFQRRIAIDTLIGGIIGAAAGIALLSALQSRLSALGTEMLGTIALAPGDWVVLGTIPFVYAAVALIAAGITVRHTLRRKL